jgi:drug/metabolite transporter (DMT)-like permease
LIERKNVDATGALLTLLTSIFWGANTVVIKLGLADAPPLRLAWMRFVVGAAAIALWAAVTGRFTGLRIARDEWRPMLMLALIFTAQIGTMNIGTSLTSAAHATILLNLYSVHTVVLSHFLVPGDRLTLRRVAGVAIAYGGIVILFAGQTGDGGASMLGDAIVFVSAFLLAERLVYLARAVQHLDPVKLLLSQAAVGSVIFMAGSALTESAPTAWTPRLVASIAYQGILIAGFNFVVNLWLLQRYRPSSLVPFFLTQPLFGVVAAALLTGDPLTGELLVACIAVAIGMGLTTR